MSFYLGLIAQFTLISLMYVSSTFSSVPSINIKIASSLKQVRVSGTDIENKIEITKSKKIYAGKKVLKFDCLPILSHIKDKSANSVHLASLKSKAGIMNWNRGGYDGKLNVILSKEGNGCDLINEISLERYISLLLTKEMNHKWPIEALKAQAVAARSYAYHKMTSDQVSKNKGYNTFYDLENSEKHQVNGTFFDERQSTILASKKTFGKILTLRDGKATPIFFHSKCGGHTLKPSQVWRNKIKGYKSVKCKYCRNHGQKSWRVNVTPKQLISVMDKTLRDFHSDKITSSNRFIKIIPDKKVNSLLRLYDGDKLKKLKKSRLRVKLGLGKAKSNNFKVSKDKKGLFLNGSGYGHGVGLCQYGAYEMAKQGFSYKQILKHYFPNHTLRSIY